MKKIIVPILLCLLPSFVWGQNNDDPNHDYTNPHRDQGNTSYIDWNRILDDYWPISTITFKVGELSFKGKIDNTKSPLTVAEVTKMVRDVMNDMEISDGMLGNIDAQLAEFQEISAVEWQQIGAQALDIALRSGVNPLGGEYAIMADAVSAYKAQLNGQSAETIIAQGRSDVCDYIVGNGRQAVIDQALAAGADLGGDVASKSLGWIMTMAAAAQLGWDLGELANKYHLWDREEWTNKMIQRQMLKELFYRTVAQKLRQRLDEHYKDGKWQIKFKVDVERENPSLFLCAIGQKWTLDCDLTKIDGKKTSRYGTYQGHIKLVAHQEELDVFDGNFQEMVILSPKLPMRVLKCITSVKNVTNSPTVLGDKILESYDFQLKVEKGRLSSTYPFTRDLTENVPTFDVNHTGEFNLEHGAYHEGELNMGPLEAKVKYKFDYYGKPLGKQGRVLALYILAQEKTDFAKVFTPYFTYHNDLTHTMKDFASNNELILRDDRIFAPLKFETGYEITAEGDPFAKQRAGSPHSQSYVESLTPTLNRSKSRASAPAPLAAPAEEEFEPAGEDGIWVYDWKSRMDPDFVEMIERGDAIVASGKLPSEFAYLLPEGLNKNDDMVLVSDEAFMVSIKARDGLSFNKLVSRLNSHGFKGEASLEGKVYGGTNDQGKECTVSFSPVTNYYVIQIENEKKTETDETVSKIEKLQKRIEAINREMQLHPEKAEELSEEMMELNLELQDEILKIQERMLDQ